MIEHLAYAGAWVCALTGSFFYVASGIGMMRMPDLFTRMHASSVSDVAGTTFMVFAMMLYSGLNLNSVRLGFMLITLLYGTSVVSHALARAALLAGVSPVLTDDSACSGCRQPGKGDSHGGCVDQ